MYPNGAGTCPVVMAAAGTANNVAFITNHIIIGAVIELIHIGSINNGLKTIGVPNVIGSLILNIEGPKQTRPKAFNLFDFENSIMIFNGKVPPVPPNAIRDNAYIVS